MKRTIALRLVALAAAISATSWTPPAVHAQQAAQDGVSAARLSADYAALSTFRPGYSFWQHIFTVPDGSIAFGSAIDGRLLAVFPTRGDWTRAGVWKDPALSHLLDGQRLAKTLDQRRDQVALLLERAVGPVVHNPTRGLFLLPNARRYGSFLQEWSTIYERFGVPGDIGLAQAAIESGLNGTRRSAARAIGFCQWLARNWKELNRLSPYVIEGHNQTTQAPYCAAYLSILATKYGSFIPALSEHHSGGTNVGRTLINGERLGELDVRHRSFVGSQFAHDLRRISLYGYRDIYRTYGPRSYLYSEMVFGNTFNISTLKASMTQTRIYAMRPTRALTIAEITRRTRLSADEVRRYNPALLQQVPAHGTLYLPVYVEEFGADVAFWHRPPDASYASALRDFLRLEAGRDRWDDPSFQSVLKGFQKRFAETNTEEGTIFATVLAYVIDEAYSSRRGPILAEFRESARIERLFERAVIDWNSTRASLAAARAGLPPQN